MNHKLFSKLNSTKASFSIKSVLVATMLIGFSTSVFATGLPVVDALQIGWNNLNSGKEVAEAIKQLQEAKKQYENMQKNLIKGSGLKDTGINMEDAFKERDAGFGLKARCPGAVLSMNPKEILTAFVINPKGDLKAIKEEQQKVCLRIVYAENLKFNETVKVLNLMRKQDDKLKDIAKRRGEVKDEPGPLQENTNELTQFMAGAVRDAQYSGSVLNAYETYIQTLKEQQTMLTQVALNGNAGEGDTFTDALAKKFVQGATLKMALEGVK